MLSGWQVDRSDVGELQSFYFDRPSLTEAFQGAIARRENVLLYGPPRQGKSLLVERTLRERVSVTFYASRSTAFADIFRTFLLTLGASVTVEQRRKKQLGAKAEVSWKWPALFGASGGVDASAESEVTQRSFSADISNPNDVCYLLREFGVVPILVIEHFEQMRRKERRLVLDFLRIAAETGTLQVVLVATMLDFPLDYGERISLSRSVCCMELPPLSRDENDRFVAQALSSLKRPAGAQTAALLYEAVEGSVEATLAGCALIGAKSRADGGDTVAADVLGEMRSQARNQLLALIAAIVEADWAFRLARRAALGGSSDAWSPDKALPIADALTHDPVFRDLHEAIVAATGERPEMAAQVSKLYDQALALGKRILATPTDAERMRLLAFAISALVQAPMDVVDESYAPALEMVPEEANVGLVLGDLLLEAALDHELAITPATLSAHFGEVGLEIVEVGENAAFERLARRLRRLQRRLGLNPPVFRVASDNDRIVLWAPQYLSTFGDIKPQLKAMLDELRDEAASL